MKYAKLFAPAVLAAAGLFAVAGAIATADESKPSQPPGRPAAQPQPAQPAGQPEVKLPPGWTEADMQACVLAATPGKMHERLAKDAGTWQGKTTMWMGPGGPAMTSDCTSAVTPIMDGRFTRTEMAGEMPGMGPYTGFGIQGYDNVRQAFVSNWIDNHGTGIMAGVGELSPDGKTMTWTHSYVCPVNKKPCVMRQVETVTGPDTKVMEMFGAEPKSGQEYKMMRIEFTRKK